MLIIFVTHEEAHVIELYVYLFSLTEKHLRNLRPAKAYYKAGELVQGRRGEEW